MKSMESNIGIGQDPEVIGTQDTSIESETTEISPSVENLPRSTPQLESLGLHVESSQVRVMQESFKETLVAAEKGVPEERSKNALSAVKQLAHMKRLGLNLKKETTWNRLYKLDETMQSAKIVDQLQYLTYLRASDPKIFTDKMDSEQLYLVTQQIEDEVFSNPGKINPLELSRVCMNAKYLGIKNSFNQATKDILLEYAQGQVNDLNNGKIINGQNFVRFVGQLRLAGIRTDDPAKNIFLEATAKEVGEAALQGQEDEGEWREYAKLGAIYEAALGKHLPLEDFVTEKLRDSVDEEYLLRDSAQNHADVAALLTHTEKVPEIVLAEAPPDNIPEQAPEEIDSTEYKLQPILQEEVLAENVSAAAIPATTDINQDTIAALKRLNNSEKSPEQWLGDVAKLQKFKESLAKKHQSIFEIQEKLSLGEQVFTDDELQSLKERNQITDSPKEKYRQKFIDSLGLQMSYCQNLNSKPALLSWATVVNFTQGFDARWEVFGVRSLFRPFKTNQELKQVRSEVMDDFARILEQATSDEHRDRLTYYALELGLASVQLGKENVETAPLPSQEPVDNKIVPEKKVLTPQQPDQSSPVQPESAPSLSAGHDKNRVMARHHFHELTIYGDWRPVENSIRAGEDSYTKDELEILKNVSLPGISTQENIHRQKFIDSLKQQKSYWQSIYDSSRQPLLNQINIALQGANARFRVFGLKGLLRPQETRSELRKVREDVLLSLYVTEGVGVTSTDSRKNRLTAHMLLSDFEY